MQNIKHFFKLFSKALATLWLLTACEPASNQASVLKLQLLWQGKPWQCGQAVQLGQQSLQLDMLQLYLSQFRQQAPVLLRQTAVSSKDAVLLGMDCQDRHAQATAQWEIPLQAPLRSGELHFTLGLPDALNHQNPLLASSVFQAPDMHWNWQFGYKFLRLDLAPQGAGTTAQPASPWSFHLGSTGCDAPSVLRAPTAPCQAPNRLAVTVAYHAGEQLTLDLAPLLQGIQPTAENSCMSDRQMRSCQQLLGRLGLTGQAQSVVLFSTAPGISQPTKPQPATAHPDVLNATSSGNRGLM